MGNRDEFTYISPLRHRGRFHSFVSSLFSLSGVSLCLLTRQFSPPVHRVISLHNLPLCLLRAHRFLTELTHCLTPSVPLPSLPLFPVFPHSFHLLFHRLSVCSLHPSFLPSILLFHNFLVPPVPSLLFSA